MQDCVAIIDIGSNAVRLIIYDAADRAPLRLHTERVICNLGASLSATGEIDAAAAEHARATLARFAGLCAAMGVGQVRAVATAALRDAKNGQDFISLVRDDCGLDIAIIDGEEEARLSALGVLSNGVVDDCVIGDYGGGSLELIVVKGGEMVQKGSLPIGSHRLLTEKTRAQRVKLIEDNLARADFLKDCTGLDFYALGGAWRSMAKAHMRVKNHPLLLLDQYSLNGQKAAAFARYLGGRNQGRLERAMGLSARRVSDMAVAALAMERVFKKIKPARLLFSATGLREGVLFEQLDAAALRADPLMTSAEKIGLRNSRFAGAEVFETLYRWMQPLFAGQDKGVQRLAAASCFLSDIAWVDPEDEQAIIGFRRVLTLPLYGADHAARAFLAVAQYVRHRGRLDGDAAARVQGLMDSRLVAQALTAGLAQRLAYLLTGGALDILAATKLEMTPRTMVLLLEGAAARLNSEAVEDAAERLAASVKRSHVIVN